MEKISLDEFKNYKFLAGVKFSPDGKSACFVVHSCDLEDNGYKSNLWVYSKEKDRRFQLTGMSKESNFLWLSDNDNLLFSAVRNPKDKEKIDNGEEFTQFYNINIQGGEAIEAFRIDRNVRGIKEIDKDTFIVISSFNMYKKDISNLREEDKAKELKSKKEEKDYEVLDEIPFWSNGSGFTNKNRNRLYLYHLNNNILEPLTDEYTNVESFELSKDKSKAIFTSTSFESKMETNNDLYLMNLKDKSLKKLNLGDKFTHTYAAFIDDNTVIVSASDMIHYGVNENEKFYLINLDTEEKSCITPDFDESIGNSVGSDCRYGSGNSRVLDDGFLYFTTTVTDSSCLNRINCSGKVERIIEGKGSIDSFDVKNGEIIYIGLRDIKLQELYCFKEGEEVQLTAFNSWVLQEKMVSRPESISVETDTGVIIDGWMLKPVNFDENNKYPAILDIHGGPKTVYGEVFYHEMQYWANEGYAVFFCNPRGSDGKGNEFADIRGKYGTIDYEDLMKFTDEVLNRYSFIDEKRVGVTGGSYGGFMTNWIIGHTNRFAAAASQRSISNWISKFCTTDIGYFFVEDQIAATPWGSQEKLWEHSPLKYADRAKTPTLFLHSEEDYRCWLAEGIQMFTALKYHGTASRLIMFRGENHELSRSGKPKHRIRRLREITEWFNKYLKA